MNVLHFPLTLLPGGSEMQELNYRDPDGPDLERTTCEDTDWDDDPISEQEELVSEEAQFTIHSL